LLPAEPYHSVFGIDGPWHPNAEAFFFADVNGRVMVRHVDESGLRGAAIAWPEGHRLDWGAWQP
jgi:hypothetical protein